MADPSSIDNGLLISLIEKKPVLWDKTMEHYKNRAATQEAWKQIMMALNPDFKTWKEMTRQSHVKMIMQRWTHIRDNYYRSYRKIQNQRRSGSKITKPYLYSKKLKFLQKIMPPINEAESNVIIEHVQSGSQENYETVEIPTADANTVYMDPVGNQDSSASNRHLLFFKGILPSLDTFDDNETLDFQMGVLKLLKKIKSSRPSQQFSSFNVKSEDTSSSHSGYS